MSSLITCQAHMIMHFCYIANSYIYGVDILNGSVLHNLPGIRRYKFRNLHDFLNIIYLGFKFKESFKIFLFLFVILTFFNIGRFLLLLKEQFLSNVSYQKRSCWIDSACSTYPYLASIFRLHIRTSFQGIKSGFNSDDVYHIG